MVKKTHKTESSDFLEPAQSVPPTPRRLVRSETDKVIAGVAGGLAQYLELDSTLIRLIFVLMAVFGGSGVLIYFILWIVMPSEVSTARSSQEQVQENIAELKTNARSMGQEFRQPSGDHSGRSMWGILLLVFGVVFLAQKFGFLHNFDIGRLWPLFLIGLGLVVLMRK